MSRPQTPASPVRTPTEEYDIHNIKRKGLHSPGRFSTRKSSLMDNPTIRMSEAPSSPVSISPPRKGIQEPSSAQYSYSPTRSSRFSSQAGREVHTPDSAAALRDSVSTLSISGRPESTEPQDGRVSRASKSSDRPPSTNPQLEVYDEDGEPHQPEPAPVLQYAHQPYTDSPTKKENRASHMTVHSAGSSSSGGDRQRDSAALRPASAYTLGQELRGRSTSPIYGDALSPNLSPAGSPRVTARNLSASRRSPDSRPLSYIDLLNNVPYSQQIAPGPNLNNAALQSAVGANASLLDTKKTLEMYRANVKKTNDPAIQYEFAIFMVNAARDAMLVEQASGDRPVTPRPDSSVEMIKEARNILQKLADRAYPFAQYYLADGYFSGLFHKDKPDYDRAFPLFVAASKHGHAEAGYRAALCYEFGWGTGKNYPKAVQFYRAAASKNHPGAAVRLGKACLTGDMGLGNRYREGVKWLKRAQESADSQYNSGPYELGLLHITGYGEDIFKDEAYAAQLLTQSAELGHIDANFRMGQAYENGAMGCPRDAALSVHFYNGAATRGMPEAMMALCAWYMVGAEPVLEKDEAEAYEWAKRAAELGFPKAVYAVGYFTEMGIGCRRDPLEANVWYVRAADMGNDTARQRLAIIRAAASGDPGMPMEKGAAKSKQLGGKEKECVVM